MEHSHLLSFGNIGDSETRELPNASVDLELPELQEHIPPRQIDQRSGIFLYDPLWPYRPELPERGVNLSCPHCHESATYQRFQLVYSPE
ncbi:MAG: hypothetical protein QOH96_2612 [Blastocatellia bacterium]|jgi:hypothetical protein|nr:hypothetical protein [Blastocatellia bacterium]